MINKDLISIVIPTYKRSNTLRRAIESALSQTYENIEVIVVDDNAEFPEIRANNRKLIEDYKGRIKLIENSINLGGGLSRNEGIKHAKGKYICFLDDDDEYLPDKVKAQYQYYVDCDNENIAMIYCYANMFRVDGTQYVHQKDMEGVFLYENVVNCIAATSWWFCPKEKLLSVNGFEDITSRQDASLLMKFFLKGYEVRRVPKILLNYYWHDANNGISKVSQKTLSAEKQYMDLFLSNCNDVSTALCKKIKYQFSYRIAHQCILLGEKQQAAKYLGKMIQLKQLDKRNIRILGGVLFTGLYRKLSNIKNRGKLGT